MMLAALSLSATSLALSGVRAPVGNVKLCAATATADATAIVEAPALRPPPYREEMLEQAAQAILRARADGANRQTVRLFLPRDDEGRSLYPPDESWEGGIMQVHCWPNHPERRHNRE
jgi:hypothetical protein